MEAENSSHSEGSPSPFRSQGGNPSSGGEGGARSFELWTSVGVCVLSLAGCVVLGTQLRIATIERPQLDSQLNYAAQRLTSTKTAKKQADETIAAREGQLKRAAEMEAKYSAILSELLELAKVDPDAKSIVGKWKIQQQGQPEAVVSRPEAKPLPAPPDSKTPKDAGGPGSAPKSKIP